MPRTAAHRPAARPVPAATGPTRRVAPAGDGVRAPTGDHRTVPLPDIRLPSPLAPIRSLLARAGTAPRRASAALLALAAAFAPHAATALEFECSVPGDVRLLALDIPGEKHLCEVSVTADGGTGQRRVPWYADNETLFCSAKLYELRDKYVDTWNFDCQAWPDGDGVDLLSARQRVILDEELKTMLGRGLRTDGPALDVRGVRAVSSTPLDAPGMLALQFLLPDGEDRVRLIADRADARDVVADVRNLSAQVDPVAGLQVNGAFVESIGTNGSLEVLTLLAPQGSEDMTAAPCEGRQTLRVAGDGTLVPLTSHRHVCPFDDA